MGHMVAGVYPKLLAVSAFSVIAERKIRNATRADDSNNTLASMCSLHQLCLPNLRDGKVSIEYDLYKSRRLSDHQSKNEINKIPADG
jgi:hypothetical protein